MPRRVPHRTLTEHLAPSLRSLLNRLLAVAAGLAVSAGTVAAAGGLPIDHTVTVEPVDMVALADAADERTASAERERARRKAVHERRQAARERRAEQKQAREQRVSRSQRRVVSDPRSIARSMLPDFGFSADQFGCLDALWTKESGWDPSASNPSSSAYGIPQALPGSKMASAGADWATNPATQIRWGLGYIVDSYGSPCSAWAHSQANGWY